MKDDEIAYAARQDLLTFSVLMKPGYQCPRHIELIARKLLELKDRKIKRLMVFMPPRHGKSHLINEIFPAWYMGNFPSHHIISTSYSQEVATDFGRRVRNLMETAEYHLIFPKAKMRQDSSAAHRFSLDTGGNYYAVGAGGPLTSRGADLIIIDDIHKNRQEAMSEAIGKGIKEWFGPVLYTRLMPGGVIVLVQTRWTLDDLPGWLLASQGKEWDVLSLPAISEGGEALWPERFPIETLNEIKKTLGSQDFSALYQQEPSPETGAVFKREWWRFYDEAPGEIDLQMQSWDLTFKGTDQSDFVVGQVWGRFGANKYLLDQFRARTTFTATISALQGLSSKWPESSAKLVEEAANGAALIDALRLKVSGLIPVKPRGSKISRASAISPQCEAGNVYLPNPSNHPWVQDFIEECATFPYGKHDDQVDAMSQALARLNQEPGTDWAPISFTGKSKWR